MDVQKPDTTNIRKVWTNKTLRKIFLEIISGTQLRKCKQIKRLIVRQMNELMMNRNLTDEMIYERFFTFVHKGLSPELQSKIQHKESYRNVNRATKISQLVARYYGDVVPTSILDVGCDDGGITAVVGSIFKLPADAIHGCDIIAPPATTDPPTFTYHLSDGLTGVLPFGDGTHDVVYAFMSLHHIQTAAETLTEVYRVLKPGGLFIIREHDCINDDYAAVLDVIHGFYSMVWSNPQEKKSFKDEYWSHYWTAPELRHRIVGCGFEELMNTVRDREMPSPYFKGHIINPLKYYYAVYRKKI